MNFITQNWGWIAGILGVVSVFSGAFYKVAVRDSVKKSELYKKDGQPIYRHRSDCDKITTSFATCLGEIKDAMETMDKRLQHDRMASAAFMAAVKERLNLNFTIPKL